MVSMDENNQKKRKFEGLNFKETWYVAEFILPMKPGTQFGIIIIIIIISSSSKHHDHHHHDNLHQDHHHDPREKRTLHHDHHHDHYQDYQGKNVT